MLSAQKKSKLTWRCRRGMLELDLLFNQFLPQVLDSMTDEEYTMVVAFLEHPDPDIYAWLMGYEVPLDEETLRCVHFIQSAIQS